MDTAQKPRTKIAAILVAIVFVFIVIFLLIDFHFLSGKVNSSSQVSSYSLGIKQGNQLPLNPTLDVYVLGSSPLVNRLAKALPNALTGNIIANAIELRDGAPAPSQNSVLVVDLTSSDMLWTPVFGRADVEYKVAYASDGEVAWIDEQSVDLSNAAPVYRLRGDYQMSSSDYGLMSLMGYRRYLSEKLAEQISSSLRERLMNPNP